MLLLAVLFCFGSLNNPAAPTLPSCSENVIPRALYAGAGVIFETTSLAAHAGGQVCHLYAPASSLGKECLLLSALCHKVALRSFAQVLHPPHKTSTSLWDLNYKQLSQIPASCEEDKNLLLFLQRRWLAKSAGFYSFMIDWVCPCYGMTLQVHPETASTYARDPAHRLPRQYKKAVETWKNTLVHPPHFPLLLTRPFPLSEYLPSYLKVVSHEAPESISKKLAVEMQNNTAGYVVVDVSEIFDPSIHCPKKWLKAWENFKGPFSHSCREKELDLKKIICIQQEDQEGIGILRILPLDVSKKSLDEQEKFLLTWVSTAGLTANWIDLDREMNASPTSFVPLSEKLPQLSKEAFLLSLEELEKTREASSPQKTLMLEGTLHVLKGLLRTLTEEKWQVVGSNPTRLAVAQLSFHKIDAQLKRLNVDDKTLSFFEFASSLEPIHADLAAMLEIFSPFIHADFAPIYRERMTQMPPSLKPLMKGAVHASAMTSVSGILRGAKKMGGEKLHVLYGENTYFECINLVQTHSKATSIQSATEKEWEEVDLILSQFHPVLKRFDVDVTTHKAEEVFQTLQKALKARKKPLTLALDCTFDFIDSPRLGNLLNAFQQEIETGILNVVCYRSGIKFDLLGMDNYYGAPFCMIHSADARWSAFDSLVDDPTLLTDSLSLNWFCLAYRDAAPYLEGYRKQIFDNTRLLLNNIPSALLSRESTYRVIPMDKDVNAAFIEMKIRGPFHQQKGSLLVGGLLSECSMESGHPLFYRQSLGFYHPNCSILYFDTCTTVRLTLGLDPAQVDVFTTCFQIFDKLNERF